MQAVAHLFAEPGHHRVDHDHGRHTEHHADDARQGDVLGPQVPPTKQVFIHGHDSFRGLSVMRPHGSTPRAAIRSGLSMRTASSSRAARRASFPLLLLDSSLRAKLPRIVVIWRVRSTAKKAQRQRTPLALAWDLFTHHGE